MLPAEPPPPRPRRESQRQFLSRSDLESITVRNIFSDDGKIPPALASKAEDGQPQTEGPAVLSQLPIKLMGTIVHTNPRKSVASVSASGSAKVTSFRVGDEIENLAEVTKIERRKVIFRNLNNRRLEYIEIPEDAAISFGVKNKEPAKGSSEVEKRGEFDFAVKRSDFDKYTQDLSSVLRQARVVPNMAPGSGGMVEGFRFEHIEQGSIFEKLGFKRGDVIKSVNGEPVNSPTKALELYNLLRSENGVAIGVERDGRAENFRYNVE